MSADTGDGIELFGFLSLGCTSTQKEVSRKVMCGVSGDVFGSLKTVVGYKSSWEFVDLWFAWFVHKPMVPI